MWHTYVRNLLKRKLKEAQEKNPAFSLRAFARKLDISPSALSEILSGRRKLSKKSAGRLFKTLPLLPEEQRKLNELLHHAEGRSLLPEDVFHLISEWQHFAIITLFELSTPPRTTRDVAERLNITLKKATESIERLVSAGLLKEETDGSYSATGEQFTTTDGPSNEAVRAAHLSNLENAATALKSVPPEERDFMSVTFAGSSKDLERARKEVRRFRDRMISIMSGASKDRAYKLSIQLYPLNR